VWTGKILPLNEPVLPFCYFHSFFLLISSSFVDRIAHPVSDFVFPDSATKKVYEIIASNLNTTRFAELAMGNDLVATLDGVPVTVFVPPDSSNWHESVPVDMQKTTIENHIFDSLLFADDLLGMDGQIMSSVNDRKWVVSVLGGSIFLAPEVGSDPNTVVEVIGRNDVLAKNGVIHGLDKALVVDLPEANCTPCDGAVSSSNSLPDGTSCSSWLQASSQITNGTDECLFERAIGVLYCGCPYSSSADFCDSCPDGVAPGAELNATHGFDCLGFGDIRAVDGNATCQAFEQYGDTCCKNPNTTAPTTVPSIAPTVPNTTAPSNNTNSSVPTTPPSVAPTNATLAPTVAPTNATLAPTVAPTNATLAPTAAPTTLAPTEPGETPAPTAAPTPPAHVQVNATFVVYNTEGLKSDVLASKENGPILQRAFKNFVDDVVKDLQGWSSTSSLQRRQRRLDITMQPDSARVFATLDVECRVNTTIDIPENATCQDVYSRYDLFLTADEDPDLVYHTYKNATDKAIEDGKLDESLKKEDPDTPFTVAGSFVPDYTRIPINASWVFFNTEGYSATDLAAPENAAILNKAFADFVYDLVNKTESTREQQVIPTERRRRRRLVVSVEPESARVDAVVDVDCREAEEQVPSGAKCQRVFGQYQLVLLAEPDPEAVTTLYVQATEEGIKNGELQESIEVIAPEGWAFTVADSYEEDKEPPQEKEDDNMQWWLILIICLSIVLGVCLLGFAVAYFTTQIVRPEEEIEASVKLMDVEDREEEENPDDVDSDFDNSDAEEDSHFWQEQESTVQISELTTPLSDRVIEEVTDEDDDDWEDEHGEEEEEEESEVEAKEYWEDNDEQEAWVGDDVTAQVDQSVMGTTVDGSMVQDGIGFEEARTGPMEPEEDEHGEEPDGVRASSMDLPPAEPDGLVVSDHDSRADGKSSLLPSSKGGDEEDDGFKAEEWEGEAGEEADEWEGKAGEEADDYQNSEAPALASEDDNKNSKAPALASEESNDGSEGGDAGEPETSDAVLAGNQKPDLPLKQSEDTGSDNDDDFGSSSEEE
jgi:hypothetical protein